MAPVWFTRQSVICLHSKDSAVCTSCGNNPGWVQLSGQAKNGKDIPLLNLSYDSWCCQFQVDRTTCSPIMMSLPYRPIRILIRSMQGWTGLVIRSHGDLVRKQSCAQGWEFDGCRTIGVQRGACFKAVLGVVESTLGTVGWDVIIYYDYLLFKLYKYLKQNLMKHIWSLNRDVSWEGSHLDLKHSMGYKDSETWCAASSFEWMFVRNIQKSCSRFRKLFLVLRSSLFPLSHLLSCTVTVNGHFPPCIFIEVAPVTTRNLDDNSTQPAVMDFWAIGKNCLSEAQFLVISGCFRK